MFGNKKTNKPQNRIDSLIGRGTRIEGSLSFSGGLRVDGEIKGDVLAIDGDASTLVLGENARIEGKVRVAHVVINGTVVGPIFASETLELQPSARVTGDVEYSCIEIQQGAVLQGQMNYLGHIKSVELKLAVSGSS
jgi:cytoskeletal protein CcmA (bactofilin family)